MEKIQNPILKGFCPDPSIIRVGSDYYLAVSTFEWWPGVRLFHSRNLRDWEQIPSPLRRKEQLDMVGDPTSGGVWAPCLSYDGSRFFLIYTDVKTKKGRYYNTHNYLVYTDDIYGEWSDPIYLNSIGFDPSLFHDTDGRKYLVNMINGFKGILVTEIDAQDYTLKGETRKVYGGSGIGCTEGPHLYHVGEWYYLLVAEGGTGYGHCVTLARARSVWGPYETAPENPILTSNTEDMTALQKCGHGSLVETQGGEWYLAHLCSRPLNGQKWCTLGRETAIQKMILDDDGWFRLKSGGIYAEKETEGICADSMEVLERRPWTAGYSFLDDFEDDKLSLRYNSPRCSYEEFTDLKARSGFLRIKGQESMNSLHHVSLVAVRQQAVSCTAETVLEFSPGYPEQLAGLAYMYDAMNFYVLGKTADEEGKPCLALLKSDMGVITDEMKPIPVSAEGAVKLRVAISKDGMSACFSYCFGDGNWHQAGQPLTTEILTDEHCRGFTGAHFGMYVHDMTGLGITADFDSFAVR